MFEILNSNSTVLNSKCIQQVKGPIMLTVEEQIFSEMQD